MEPSSGLTTLGDSAAPATPAPASAAPAKSVAQAIVDGLESSTQAPDATEGTETPVAEEAEAVAGEEVEASSEEAPEEKAPDGQPATTVAAFMKQAGATDAQVLNVLQRWGYYGAEAGQAELRERFTKDAQPEIFRSALDEVLTSQRGIDTLKARIAKAEQSLGTHVSEEDEAEMPTWARSLRNEVRQLREEKEGIAKELAAAKDQGKRYGDYQQTQEYASWRAANTGLPTKLQQQVAQEVDAARKATPERFADPGSIKRAADVILRHYQGLFAEMGPKRVPKGPAKPGGGGVVQKAVPPPDRDALVKAVANGL